MKNNEFFSPFQQWATFSANADASLLAQHIPQKGGKE